MTIPPLFGPYGIRALEFAGRLREHGVNAIWFHGFSDEAFEACARHGLAACVEFPTFRAKFEQRPDLVPIGKDGNPIAHGRLVQGICLSHRDFVDEIAEKLLAGVRKYKPVGIWLDYLTYGGWFETPDPELQESCFCPACIADFCEAKGRDAMSATEILTRHQEQWTQHKCERISRFARQYAGIIRSHIEGCLIGAYMCPWQPEEFDAALTRIFAQDYGLLSESVDVFTPLIYVSKSGRSADWGSRFLQNASLFVPRNRRVQLILDALDFPGSLLATASSPIPSWGLQLFGGADVFGDPQKAALFKQAADKIRDCLVSA